MGGETRCKWCGAAIKPWTDRYVDMAGGELCQDGGQEQFARRHSPAERVIEVAPQAYSAWTPEKEQEMLEKAVRGVERMNPNDNEANMISAVLRETLPEVAPQGEIPDDLKTLYYTSKNNFGIVETSTVRLMTLIERIGRAESALTAMTEERDRARDAIYWADGQRGEFRERGPKEGAYWWRKELMERAGLKPVSDRLPEGETKCQIE